MADEDSGGVPEWVVTYGDMMSLLLTFFIMLVSLSEVVADKRYRAILESIQRYIGYDTAPVGPPGKNYPVNSLVERLEMKLGSFTNEDDGRGGVRAASVPGIDMRVFRNREGVEQRVGKPILFEPGRADLTDEAKRQLPAIVRAVAGKPNKIEVRAHASRQPLPPGSPFEDKIELTYERARAVANFLIAHGIDRDRIRLTAAADNEPLQQSGDKTEEHQDRAEVYISDAFVSEYIGPRDIPD
ncbi:MAG: OmpA family protein [Planctomycetes bacterium]|nr:OmpA family protein [Planctomycetota bacterium]